MGRNQRLPTMSPAAVTIGAMASPSRTEPTATAAAPVSVIAAAAQQDCRIFAALMEQTSLDAAVDVWLKRVARRKMSPVTRARLIKAVARGVAPHTREVQLVRAALLRGAGLDERAAAAAAVAAGATYAEVGEVLGMSQQGARKRVVSLQQQRREGDQP